MQSIDRLINTIFYLLQSFGPLNGMVIFVSSKIMKCKLPPSASCSLSLVAYIEKMKTSRMGEKM